MSYLNSLRAVPILEISLLPPSLSWKMVFLRFRQSIPSALTLDQWLIFDRNASVRGQALGMDFCNRFVAGLYLGVTIVSVDDFWTPFPSEIAPIELVSFHERF